jgi:hypothetical protein
MIFLQLPKLWHASVHNILDKVQFQITTTKFMVVSSSWQPMAIYPQNKKKLCILVLQCEFSEITVCQQVTSKIYKWLSHLQAKFKVESQLNH